MRDDELRDGMAAWLGPVQQAPAPDVGVIRRRLRRRRARQAAAGTVLCALAAAGALTLAQGSAGPAPDTGPGPAVHPPCRASQLRVGPAAVLVRTNAFSQEPLPDTYLLRIENTGHAACSLTGWPRLSIAALRAMRDVAVSYGTLLTWPTRHGAASRVVEPATVVLAPQAQAAAMVTVTYPLAEQDCAPAAWSVTPPGGRPTVVRQVQARGPRHGLLICRTSTVTVSPVYPAAVPVTQNYPRSAPREAPASLAGSLPAPGAGPAAAPFFMETLPARRALVYDWATGRVTAVIRPPRTAQYGFTGVAAAGDDRTFVLAAGTDLTRFYQVTLTQQGTLAQPLTQLPVPPVAAHGNPLFAVSPDGSELALALPQPGGVASGEIMVVSLVNGSVRIWRSPDPGWVYGLSWEDPLALPGEAWSGHPRLLFGWMDNAPDRQAARQRSGLRLLDPGVPGTSLLGSRLLIPASVRVGALRTLDYPLITSAGTVVFATMTSAAGGGNPQAAVVAFSAATGRPLGVVTPLVGESGMGTWCGAVWADPSGSHALAACGTGGEVSGTHFTQVNLHFPVPNFSSGRNYFAW